MPDIDRYADYQVACTECIYTRYQLYTLACHSAQTHANARGHRVNLVDTMGGIAEVMTPMVAQPIPDDPPF